MRIKCCTLLAQPGPDIRNLQLAPERDKKILSDLDSDTITQVRAPANGISSHPGVLPEGKTHRDVQSGLCCPFSRRESRATFSFLPSRCMLPPLPHIKNLLRVSLLDSMTW